VVKSILKYLNGLPECRATKVSGDAKKSGEPDIDGCLRGRSLKFEVKRPGGKKATPLQLATLTEWKAAGAITGVVHSVDEVKDLIKELI